MKIVKLLSLMGKGVVQDHFLVEVVAKYTRHKQLRKDLVECLSAKTHFGEDSSGLHGGGRDHGGPKPMVKGQHGKIASTNQRRRRWQRSTSSTDVRTLWKTWSCELVLQDRPTQGGNDKGKGKHKDGKALPDSWRSHLRAVESMGNDTMA